jgi:hypothetical protein
MVLDVEPPLMPPLVGLRGGEGHVLMGPESVKMDSSAAYRGHQPILLLDQGDSEEVPPKLDVGFDPQESLAQRDEGHDLWDPIRVEMLQLDLVVMAEPQEEGMRGHPKPALVEVHEGDDVTITWCWHLLTAR